MPATPSPELIAALRVLRESQRRVIQDMVCFGAVDRDLRARLARARIRVEQLGGDPGVLA